MQRLRAVKALADAGIDVGVLMAPLVPGFSTAPAKIEATIKAIADHGARFVGANVLFLDGGTRDHFMRFLSDEFPALVDQYDRLYASKYAPRDYVVARAADAVDAEGPVWTEDLAQGARTRRIAVLPSRFRGIDRPVELQLVGKRDYDNSDSAIAADSESVASTTTSPLHGGDPEATRLRPDAGSAGS